MLSMNIETNPMAYLAHHHVQVVDTAFQKLHFDASYLLTHAGHAAFIDCGTNHSVPRLLAALASLDLTPAAVDYLILTHVHLDHAGGAGELMAQLPNAKLIVHPRGARHMIDPSKLWAGATAVYGEEEMQRSYGRLKPVPAERVVTAPDGFVVDLAGRELRCLDTPGHAKHHNAILDVASGLVFTGDTFGLSYREFDTAQGAFILPTTSPVQFDPAALHASVQRVADLAPPFVCPTHYGPVADVARLAQDLHACIDAMVAIAHRHAASAARHAAIKADLTTLYLTRLRAHGCTLPDTAISDQLHIDIELNAQGLGVWLDKLARDAAAAP